MMFLEHWNSPRTSLFSLFNHKDVQNIRIKFANDLMFSPRNSGRKDLVITYKLEVFTILNLLFNVQLLACLLIS